MCDITAFRAQIPTATYLPTLIIPVDLAKKPVLCNPDVTYRDE